MPLARRLKRYVPSAQRLQRERSLGALGAWVTDANLWHLNRRSVSGGVAVGLFCAFLPMPFEMLAAAFAAVVLRVNLPLSVALVWVSNPLTWVPLYGPAYLLGTRLLGVPALPLETVTLTWLGQHFAALWLGCVIVGAGFAAAGYLLVRGLWRLHIAALWRNRKHLRRRKSSTENQTTAQSVE